MWGGFYLVSRVGYGVQNQTVVVVVFFSFPKSHGIEGLAGGFLDVFFESVLVLAHRGFSFCSLSSHHQLSATLAIPFWQWFLTRFGKKSAVYFGTSVRPAAERSSEPKAPLAGGHPAIGNGRFVLYFS